MFTGIHFSTYKSFSTAEELHTLDGLKRVNVFALKNNSEKSSVLGCKLLRAKIIPLIRLWDC